MRTSVSLFADDFAHGISPDRWVLRPVGDLPRGDGVITTTPDGVVVVSSGVNAATGEPCFVSTEHMTWQAMPAAGIPGFDVAETGVLAAEVTLAAGTFGTAAHPFGDAVADPDRDLRLGAVGVIAVDLATGMIFNFSVTNGAVFALYERLPGEGRSSFCSAVQIAERSPGQVHRLGFRYDRAAGTVSWLVDGVEAFSVDRIGFRSADARTLIDRGGVDELAAPARLLFGLCTFTLLDAVGPTGGAPLVTGHGQAAQTAWGQGARIDLRRFEVSATS